LNNVLEKVYESNQKSVYIAQCLYRTLMSNDPNYNEIKDAVKYFNEKLNNSPKYR